MERLRGSRWPPLEERYGRDPVAVSLSVSALVVLTGLLMAGVGVRLGNDARFAAASSEETVTVLAVHTGVRHPSSVVLLDDWRTAKVAGVHDPVPAAGDRLAVRVARDGDGTPGSVRHTDWLTGQIVWLVVFAVALVAFARTLRTLRAVRRLKTHDPRRVKVRPLPQ